MKIALVLLLSAAVSLSAQTAGPTGGNPESLIARLWLEQAARILSETDPGPEDLNEASRALEIASEFASPGRDALYLQALLILRGYPSDDPVRSAYHLLGLSLTDTGQPDTPPAGDITSFEDRARLWAAQALRLKEYRTLLEGYRSWPAGHRDDPELLYAAARAAVYLGLDTEAAELARRGEVLADGSTDLSLLGPAFLQPAQPAFRALALASGSEAAPASLEAAWRRWNTDLEEALLPWMLSGRIRVSDSPVYAWLLTPETRQALSFMNNPSETGTGIPSGLIGDLAYIRRAGLNPEDALPEGFTGTLAADADYDGYAEEICVIVDGRPVSRRIDEDQDGVPEWKIEYEGLSPVSIDFGAGALKAVYESGAYPAVLSVIRSEGSLGIQVFFQPGGFEWSPLPPGMYLATPVPPGWDENDFWYASRMVTVVLDNPGEGVTSKVSTVLLDGYPLRAVELSYPSGSPGKPYWVRELIYDGGVPAAGRRSFRSRPDSPENRIWELYERFENGRMVGLAWDPGMTGTPVYLRDWALERFFETQVWDLDADRWVDVRRFVLPDGSSSARELPVTEAGPEDFLPWTTSDWAPWEY